MPHKNKVMPIRVLVVGMSGIIGGVERVVLSVVSKSTSTHFDFLCYGDNYSYEKELPDSKFFYLPRRRKNYFTSQKKLKEFFQTHRDDYDCIWVNTSSASNLSIHRMAKRYSNAVIITHSHNSKVDHDNPFLRKVHEILHLINRHSLVKNTDVLVACSKSAAKHLYGTASDKAIIIYNGIDTERFAFDLSSRNIQREQLGISEKSKVILSFGRLEKVKNVRKSVEMKMLFF